jgi:hypothetical protein
MSKRLVRVAVIFGVLVVAGALAWRFLHLSELAHLGTGYAAQQTCACLFVSGRSLESCRMDLDPLARKLVSITPGPGEVTARSMGVAKATSRYQKGFGCSLLD